MNFDQREGGMKMRSVLIKSMFILSIILLPEMAHGYPGFTDRFVNERQIETTNTLLNIAKFGKGDIVAHVNEELLSPVKYRYKRLSDQRRAELETLMALSKMTGKLMTVSRGGRQLDTTKIGRRKRATLEQNLKRIGNLFRLSRDLRQKGNAAYSIIS